MSLSRRDFLKVVFGTLPAAALAATNPITATVLRELWPEEKQNLPVHEPYTIAIDETGYLYDPDFDYDSVELPTWREQYCVDSLSDQARLNFYQEWHWDVSQIIEEELDLDDPLAEVSVDHLDILDRHFEGWLDSQVAWDYISPHEAMVNSEYWPGTDLVEELGFDVADELGLVFVEGEHPGSSFCAAKFIGNDVEALNRAFFEHGINLQVQA